MTPATATERPGEQTADKTAIRPFQVNVPEEERTELRRRVLAAHLPERETVTDFSQGVPLDTVQKLARYWATEYDWRKVEARPVETSTDDDGLSAFLNVRPRLFGIAYRMLGSAAAAEDIVQDVWVRWQTTDRSVVRDTPAFLATTTTRLAINVIKSARSRRETYMGPSLPEPVDTSADPALGAERSEALEFAVLLLLEKLSPTERAAYVLREAFDYSYREIADILRLEEANTRQLVTRARQHLAAGRCAPAQPVPCDRGRRDRACRRWLAA
jgi:RNA polymerase sigma factor (sigma-70 family)